MNTEDLFSAEELAAAARTASEFREEVEEWARWLQTPEATAEAAKIAQAAQAAWDELVEECKRGTFVLAPAEIEQLQRDGILVKPAATGTPQKRGEAKRPPLLGGADGE